MIEASLKQVNETDLQMEVVVDGETLNLHSKAEWIVEENGKTVFRCGFAPDVELSIPGADKTQITAAKLSAKQ